MLSFGKILQYAVELVLFVPVSGILASFYWAALVVFRFFHNLIARFSDSIDPYDNVLSTKDNPASGYMSASYASAFVVCVFYVIFIGVPDNTLGRIFLIVLSLSSIFAFGVSIAETDSFYQNKKDEISFLNWTIRYYRQAEFYTMMKVYISQGLTDAQAMERLKAEQAMILDSVPTAYKDYILSQDAKIREEIEHDRIIREKVASAMKESS